MAMVIVAKTLLNSTIQMTLLLIHISANSVNQKWNSFQRFWKLLNLAKMELSSCGLANQWLLPIHKAAPVIPLQLALTVLFTITFTLDLKAKAITSLAKSTNQ